MNCNGHYHNAPSEEVGESEIMTAIRMKDKILVNKLLKDGMDLSLTTMSGRTALMYAAESGMSDIVKLLIEHGADINASDRLMNLTALMYASMLGNEEVVDVLLSANADTQIRSSDSGGLLDGLTAAQIASRSGHIMIGMKIMQHVANNIN